MKKLTGILFLSFLAVPALMAAEELDIIYVNGKPVYIEGIDQPISSTRSRSKTYEDEVARSKAPSTIYRGTVLGSEEQDIYRGTVFGQPESATPSANDIVNGKTKIVYDTSLVRAIKLNDADRVRTLIYANVDVNERNYAGMTPLTIAAEKGNLDIIKLLVEDGAAAINVPSSYGITPLITASAAGHREVVKYLLENGADPTAKDDLGKTALHHAMAVNDKKLTDILISQNNRAINFPDNSGNTPLIYAAQNDNVANIKTLLNHKADVNYQNPISGFTALAAAATAGQEQAAKVLVDSGADVNMPDNSGRTALFYAAENGQTAFIKKLIRMGADLNVTDHDGMNILDAAARAQSLPSVQLFVPQYFSVNQTDVNGMTPLMHSTVKGIDTLQWLIDKKADLNIQDANGNTALMHAVMNRNERAALLLLKEDVDLTARNKEGEDVFTLAEVYLPKSTLNTVLQVKKKTTLQQQLQARQAALALAQQEQEKLMNQAEAFKDIPLPALNEEEGQSQGEAATEETLQYEPVPVATEIDILSNKKAEIKQLEKQLKQEEALVKKLQKERQNSQYQAVRKQVEQEYTDADDEVARLQRQLEEAKARREAQINAQIEARLQELEETAE